MLIVMDVGNTHIVIGLFDGPRLLKDFRLATNRHSTADEFGLLLTGLLKPKAGIPWSGAAIASVVPSLDTVIDQAVRRTLGLAPLWITPEMRLPVKNGYRPPSAVGADRLMNAVAAVAEFGAPVVVVDFGTATTVDWVSPRREYLGGAILPGPQLAADALSRGTSLLPNADLRPIRSEAVMGRSTQESLRAGLVLGTAGAVDYLLRGLQRQAGRRVPAVATGGLAPLIAPHCPRLNRIRPHLTLDGLRLTWEAGRRPGSGRRRRA